MSKKKKFNVISHDCEADGDSCVVYGPFKSEIKAEDFVRRNQLDTPVDGGCAFAIVVPYFEDEGLNSPKEWDRSMAGV
jgi:hypothetical protein